MQSNKIVTSNPRPTTREFVHLVTCGHFRSRDEDGGYTIRYAVAKIPATCKLHGSIFYRTGVIADRSFTLRE